ncbi:alkaline phosphatase [Ruficoccus amylovorans]|uniref:Alkaline phosphatase n=1 Tax=Ruficoccus amylovorans TaxID=1804625 RepID=A0A842HEX6_9BACT|nr:alkaline phosphatase [Ruficoccus amylovorans]MBC2594196.1 alkaline phosphatase [Ruficoccus amylovorans]
MNKFFQTCAIAGLTAAAAFTATSLEARPSRATTGAKYIIFLIGDGMSSVQVQATEAFLAANNGLDPNVATEMDNAENLLNMNLLPVRGINTTYASNRFITDSAAAGTALATGSKTNYGVIGKDTSLTQSYMSIAEMAQEKNYKVGIVSSVSLDHATPGAFYANVDSRNSYELIAVQAAQSGFNFFGGGGWRRASNNAYPAAFPAMSGNTLTEMFTLAGYSMLNDETSIRALKSAPQDMVVCTVPVLQSSDAMPYEIDRAPGAISLAEMTEIAIDCLYANNTTGFFLMVEGGKIDWACHANDPMGTIGDMVDFDNAVGKAIEFYNQHPDETLIVVTGDHETGGLTIGFSGTGYETSFANLLNQASSYEAFGAVLAAYKTNRSFSDPYDPVSENIDSAMKTQIVDSFGIDYDSLSAYRQQRLEDAFDRSMGGVPLTGTSAPSGYVGGSTTIDSLNYGGYDALTMELCHQFSQDTGLGWTSYAHTAVPIPVMAMGFDDYRFAGFYDNTDIAKSIAAAMRVSHDLPHVVAVED